MLHGALNLTINNAGGSDDKVQLKKIEYFSWIWHNCISFRMPSHPEPCDATPRGARPPVWEPLLYGNISSSLCQLTNFVMAGSRDEPSDILRYLFLCHSRLVQRQDSVATCYSSYHQAHPSSTRAGSGPPPRTEMYCSRPKRAFAPHTDIARPLYRVLQKWRL
jgi:hypothetical protein